MYISWIQKFIDYKIIWNKHLEEKKFYIRNVASRNTLLFITYRYYVHSKIIQLFPNGQVYNIIEKRVWPYIIKNEEYKIIVFSILFGAIEPTFLYKLIV